MVKILNAYAGLGGNRKKWPDKHDITAVEIDPAIAEEYRRLYPQDTVLIEDAHQHIRQHFHEYDFIWSSPPCPTHSKMQIVQGKSDKMQNRNRKPQYPDMRLYQEIIFLRTFYEGDWVVENVKPYYDPLIQGQRCGRHMVWSNFSVPDIEVPRNFNLTGASTKTKMETLQDWLGIHPSETIYVKDSHDPAQVLRNCVHPDVGAAILKARSRRQVSLEEIE